MRGALAVVVVLAGACAGAPTDPAPAARDTGAGSPPTTAAPPSPSPSPSPSPHPELGTFDPGAALEVAARLAVEVGPRPAGSPGDGAARRLVRGLLEEAGWSVVEEAVALPQGGSSANLVAARRAGDLRGPHVVIGAHLDTVAGSPGANDNGSGVGVLVALARELADEPASPPVVLVAFAAEEVQPVESRRHHVGSEAYARRHGDQVAAMLSVDMVGTGTSTCICWLDGGPPTLARHLEALARQRGIAPVEVQAEGDFSDHGPFARRGLAAAHLWGGPDPRHHRPGDTPEHLEADAVQRAGALALALAREPAPSERRDPQAASPSPGSLD